MLWLYNKLNTLRNWEVFVLIIFLVLLCFGKSLSNGYALDDHLGPQHPLVANGLSNIGKVFTQPMDFSEGKAYDYRPISILSFMTEMTIWGENVMLSHAVNLLLYALICYMAFLVLIELNFLNKLGVVLVIVLFTVHPIHSEVALSLKNRDELLASFFVLAAFMSLLKWSQCQQIIYLSIGLVLFSLAVLSKVSASPFFVIIAFSLFWIGKVSLRKAFFLSLALFAFGNLRTILIHTLVNQDLGRVFTTAENPLVANTDPWFHFWAIGETIAFYFQKLIIPVPLSSYYGQGAIHLTGFSLGSLAGWMIIIFSLGLIIILLIKQRAKWLLWLLAGLLATLLPYVNWPSLVPGIVAERLAFMTVLFASGLFVFAAQFYLGKSRVLIVVGIILFPLCYLSWSRSFDWENNQTLLERDSAKLPQSVHLHFMLAREYMGILNQQMKIGQKPPTQLVTGAVNEFKNVYAEYPEHKADAANALGTLESTFRNNQAIALQYFNEAVASDSVNITYLWNLAKASGRAGEFEQAQRAYSSLHRLKPSIYSYHAELMDVLLKLGRTKKVFEMNEKAFGQYPNNHDGLYIFMGVAKAMESDNENALFYFKKALEISPENKALLVEIERLSSNTPL